MEIRKEEYYIPSSNGIDQLYVKAYIPNNDYYGYIQIIHDQYEHLGCYEEVMKWFADYGYVCFGHDQIGHGKTATHSNRKLGVIETRGGMTDLLNDCYRTFVSVFTKFSPKHKRTYTATIKEGEHLFPKQHEQEFVRPPIHALVGVGLGSSLAKIYPIAYDDANCIVLCGDPGFPPFSKKEINLCDKYIRKYGRDASSEELTAFLEKGYRKGFDTEDRFAYRSCDRTVMNQYYKDSLVQFEYDLKSLKIILEAEHAVNITRWCESYPLFLATFVIGGEKDPVSKNTRELGRMVSYMKHAGLKNVFAKYYKGAHNLLCDSERKIVISDIIYIIKAIENQQYKDANQKEVSKS